MQRNRKDDPLLFLSCRMKNPVAWFHEDAKLLQSNNFAKTLAGRKLYSYAYKLIYQKKQPLTDKMHQTKKKD